MIFYFPQKKLRDNSKEKAPQSRGFSNLCFVLAISEPELNYLIVLVKRNAKPTSLISLPL
jgi:hypothetical protein